MSRLAVQPAMPVALNLPAKPRFSDAVAIGDDSVAWAESPARLLHDRLVQSFSAPEAVPEQILTLPVRTRLVIIFGSSTLLWTAIGGIMLLLR